MKVGPISVKYRGTARFRELDESARLSITLPAADRRDGEIVPVHLDAVINEVGVLKLYMQDVASGRKWDLEFNVRPHEQA